MKVLILGIVASDKTTLARRLSFESRIKHYEIDQIVYDDFNDKKRYDEEQQEIIKRGDKNYSWIIEGTLRKKLDNLLDLADTIVYIDIPLNVRKIRILGRFIKQLLRIEKCNYKPTFKMLRMMYVWTNEFEKNKIDFEKKINKYSNKLIVLDSIESINNYKLQGEVYGKKVCFVVFRFTWI